MPLERLHATLIITGAPMDKVPADLMAPVVRSGDVLAQIGVGVYVDVNAAQGDHGSVVMHGVGGSRVTYRDIFAAQRADRHMRSYYAGVYQQVLLACMMCRNALQQTWFVESTDAGRIREYTALITSAIEELEGRRQGFLESAQEILECAASLDDVLGRFNPFSRAAMLCAIMRRLEGYANFRSEIIGEVGLRDQALYMELERTMAILYWVTMELTEMSRWWRDSRWVKDDNHARRLAKRMGVCVEMLQQIVVKPFRALAYRTRQDVEMVGGLIEHPSARDAEAANFLDRALRALQLPQMHCQIHEIIAAVSLADRWGSRFEEHEIVAALRVLRPVHDQLGRLDDRDFQTRIVDLMHMNLGLAMTEFQGSCRLKPVKRLLLDAVAS